MHDLYYMAQQGHQYRHSKRLNNAPSEDMAEATKLATGSALRLQYYVSSSSIFFHVGNDLPAKAVSMIEKTLVQLILEESSIAPLR